LLHGIASAIAALARLFAELRFVREVLFHVVATNVKHELSMAGEAIKTTKKQIGLTHLIYQ
jgi:hypothetical protein